jgi:hypothetical protein
MLGLKHEQIKGCRNVAIPIIDIRLTKKAGSCEAGDACRTIPPQPR